MIQVASHGAAPLAAAPGTDTGATGAAPWTGHSCAASAWTHCAGRLVGSWATAINKGSSVQAA